MRAVVHAADLQDRDGGVLVMASLLGRRPFLLELRAGSGYAGPKVLQALARVCRQVSVGIVKRSDAGGFVALPERRIVERSVAWPKRCRRLAEDWDRLNRDALAFLPWASARLMARRLCQAKA